MRRRASRLVASVAVFALSFGLSGRAHATASPSTTAGTSPIAPQRVGGVNLVEADRRGVVLAEGGSSTEFSLSLPGSATCPGDSRNDNWRVQTFIVAGDTDPASIQYGPNGPTGEHQWAFYDTVTSPVIEGLLVPNDAPGSPARVDTFRSMSFRVFPVGEIPPGVYRVGVACTWFGATGPYWDTEMVFSAAPDDQPAQLRWTIPGAAESGAGAPSSGASSSPPWTLIFILIAVFAFGVAFFLGRKPGQPKRSIT